MTKEKITIYSDEYDEDFRQEAACELFMWGGTADFDDYDIDIKCQELLNEYRKDEKSNLDKELDNNIVAIGSIGHWDGKRTAFRDMGKNLNSILSYHMKGKSSINVYIENYDVHCKESHHDGVNYIVYRELDGIDIDQFEEAFCHGYDVEELVEMYTTSVAPYVKEIYGI